MDPIAYISSWHTECGIARFTEHVLNSVKQVDSSIQQQIIAVGNCETPGKEVVFRIRKQDLEDYSRAAEYVNRSDIAVVNLEHEFGLFGGTDGKYIIDLINRLEKPLITTMHTARKRLTEEEKSIVKAISEKSQAIIMMARGSIPIVEKQGIDPKKITVIPHGHYKMRNIDGDEARKDLGLEGRFVIANIGFVRPSKGMRLFIKTLPELIKKNPNMLYLMAGETSPTAPPWEKAYRKKLEKLVHKLGLEDYVRFDNKWLSEEEKLTYYAAAHVVLTLYTGLDQTSSGSLAEAAGMGKAIVSSRYTHAEELLADGRGLLVGLNPHSVAKNIEVMFDDKVRRGYENKMREYSENSTWEKVAQAHIDLFKAVARTVNTDTETVQRRTKVTAD